MSLNLAFYLELRNHSTGPTGRHSAARTRIRSKLTGDTIRQCGPVGVHPLGTREAVAARAAFHELLHRRDLEAVNDLARVLALARVLLAVLLERLHLEPHAVVRLVEADRVVARSGLTEDRIWQVRDRCMAMRM